MHAAIVILLTAQSKVPLVSGKKTLTSFRTGGKTRVPKQHHVQTWAVIHLAVIQDA